MKYSLATAVLLVVPSVAFAQEQRIDDVLATRSVGFACIGALLLLVLGLVVLLLVVLRRSGAMKQGEYLGRAGEHIEQSTAYMERANAYMERQEERELRIIQLLESIETELKHRDAIKRA